MTLALRPLTIALLCLGALVSLVIAVESTVPQKKPKHPILHELKVEVRADGLAYGPGGQKPFTGAAIDLHLQMTPPRLARQTPYVEGRKHGEVMTFSPGGKLKDVRTYQGGKPISWDMYHGNGQKKVAMKLNDKDVPEGSYQRWYDNGVLESEATFDENGLFHGEEKDYDREGKLSGHFRKEHGKLVEVIFETPEMHKIRTSAPAPAAPAPRAACGS